MASFPDKPVAHLLGANGPVHAVTYSASPGVYILAGSADRAIRLYNPFPSTTSTTFTASKLAAKKAGGGVPEGRLIQAYEGHGYEVLSLAVAGDNERFVSGGGDRAVFLWDVGTATTIRRFGGSAAGGHSSRVNAVSFAGEGDSVVVSGSFDTSVRLWDVRSGSFKPIQVLDEARDAVTSLVVRGPEIVAGSVDGRVRSYDVRMGRCATDVLGASVTSLDVTKDGKALLAGTLDSKIRLLDRDTGSCLRAYADQDFVNTSLRVQSLLGGSERYVVAGDEAPPDDVDGGRIWAWDLLTGKVVKKITVPWGPEPGTGAGAGAGAEQKRRRAVGRDGKEKVRRNVVSCMAWREDGWGDQFCVGATSGVVTVFGAL